MLRLTLRTLLAYIDDTLAPAQARELGEKVAASEPARELIERIKRVTRRRALPPAGRRGPDGPPARPAGTAADRARGEKRGRARAFSPDHPGPGAARRQARGRRNGYAAREARAAGEGAEAAGAAGAARV